MSDNSHIVKSFFKQINKSVDNKTSQMTQIKSAIVHSVNLDGTVNITIPPSSTVYHNIQNQSIYRNLVPGDNVKIIKENNDLSNMWIIGGFGLKQIEETKTTQSNVQEGDFSKIVSYIETQTKENSSKINSVVAWQSQVYNDVSRISQIEQQSNNNEASIDLVVESTGTDKKIKATDIILAINNNESTVQINANKVELSNYVTFDNLQNYEEATALNTQEIQKLKKRVSDLEEIIGKLFSGNLIIEGGTAPIENKNN